MFHGTWSSVHKKYMRRCNTMSEVEIAQSCIQPWSHSIHEVPYMGVSESQGPNKDPNDEALNMRTLRERTPNLWKQPYSPYHHINSKPALSHYLHPNPFKGGPTTPFKARTPYLPIIIQRLLPLIGSAKPASGPESPGIPGFCGGLGTQVSAFRFRGLQPSWSR